MNPFAFENLKNYFDRKETRINQNLATLMKASMSISTSVKIKKSQIEFLWEQEDVAMVVMNLNSNTKQSGCDS